MNNFLIIIALVLFLQSCNTNNQIIDGKDLSRSELIFLKNQKLLEKDETILLFQTNGPIKSWGFFISDKKICKYYDGSDGFQSTGINLCDVDSVLLQYHEEIDLPSHLLVYNNGRNWSEFLLFDTDSTDIIEFCKKFRSQCVLSCFKEPAFYSMVSYRKTIIE